MSGGKPHNLAEPHLDQSMIACLLSCPTLCDPTDCNLPGSSVHGIFQARILEWVAISFSRGSFRPRDRISVSWSPALAGRFLPLAPPGKPEPHFGPRSNRNDNQIHFIYIRNVDQWFSKYGPGTPEDLQDTFRGSLRSKLFSFKTTTFCTLILS